MLTLWDLIRPKKRAKPAPVATPAPAPPAPVSRSRPAAQPCAAGRYEQMTRTVLKQHGVRVRRWRTAMTGVAWELRAHNGEVTRMIEAPRPKGPMSAAIFLHEIGHHAIGFNRYRPRCLEEYHAWAWALAEMERHGIAVTDSVRLRMHQSLHYAVEKAARRGLRGLPAELLPYAQRPPQRLRRPRA